MRFSTTFLSFTLLLAGSQVEGALIKKQHRRHQGPSAILGSSPASTLSASTPTATPSSSSVPITTSSGLKRGLAYNDISLTKDFNSGEVSWAYNWGSSYSGSLPSGVVFFPMLWGSDAGHTNTWIADANAAIAAGATHLLGFNEPDLSSQSNISPAAAAAAWKTYMEPFYGKATLVSPAITNGGAPMGTAWMDSFIAACTGCHIDKIAMHIYDSATNVAYYQSYITSVGTRYGRPVMVTEMGASGTQQQQIDFLNQMVPFLNGLSSVSHYAYFGVFAGNLVNSDGSLTALGQAYVSS